MSEGVDLKKLRLIARVHIEKAAAGDMQTIKELADRLDGRPAQTLEHSGPIWAIDGVVARASRVGFAGMKTKTYFAFRIDVGRRRQ